MTMSKEQTPEEANSPTQPPPELFQLDVSEIRRLCLPGVITLTDDEIREKLWAVFAYNRSWASYFIHRQGGLP